MVGRGQIGTALFHALEAEHEIDWHHSRMEDLRAGDFKGKTFVLNAAGKTDLGWCEANPREAFRTNVEHTLGLYREVRKADAFLIHLSSGCIWDGPYREGGHAFRPYDAPTPASFYAWTKAVADAEMLQEAGYYGLAILRPRQVFSGSASPRNTLQKLRRYERLINTDNSMTSVDAIVSVVKHLIGHPETGIWNVYNRGIIRPYGVGVMLAEAGLREMPTEMTMSIWPSRAPEVRTISLGGVR